VANQIIERECRDPNCFPPGYIHAPRADTYLHYHKVDEIESGRTLAHDFGSIPDGRDIYTCKRCKLRLSSLGPRDILNLNIFGVCCKDEEDDDD
jgi:hypothetical protein